MKKKTLSLMLTLAMLIGLFVPFGAISTGAETVKSISSFSESDASGTVYTISSASDLLAFRDKIQASTNKGSGYIFRLTADIDLNPGWVGKPFVNTDAKTVAVPSAPDTAWKSTSNELRVFKGTFDGQGHILAGLYSDYTVGQYWNRGGLFDTVNGATIKNLVVINSFLGLHMTNNKTNGDDFGALLGIVDGSTTVENVYADLSVWQSGFSATIIGGFVGSVRSGAALTIRNSVYAGTIGTVSTTGETAYPSTSTGTQMGQVAGKVRDGSITCTNTALLGSLYTNGTANALAGSGSVSATNVVVGKYASVSAASSAGKINGYNSGTIAMTYSDFDSCVLPTGVVGYLPIESVSGFSESDIIGTVYTISTKEELLAFSSLVGAAANKGAGYTFKLMADIDLNSGWVAKPDIDTTMSTVTFPDAPATSWTGIDFSGVFDGQGHTVAGIYREWEVGEWGDVGLFFRWLQGNAVVRNLVLTNGLFLTHQPGNATSNRSLGGLVGLVNGNYVTIENVFVDLDIWDSGESTANLGGIAGKVYDSNVGLKISNVVFAGTIGNVSFNGSLIYPSSGGSSAAQLIGNANSRPVTCTNTVLAGNIYTQSGTWDNIVKSGGANVTKTNIVVGKYTTVDSANSASAITGYNSGSISMVYNGDTEIIVPTTVNAMGLDAQLDHVNTTRSIMDYTGSESALTTFTISNTEELLYAAQLSQQGVTFNRQTLLLTADIDLNPGWDADVTITDGTATLPSIPPVMFPGFATLRGKLDGNGHTIYGVFMAEYFTLSSSNLGFIEILGANGFVKDLKFANSFIFADMKDNEGVQDCKIAGVVARIQGNQSAIDTVYADINVWYRSSTWERIGGIVGKADVESGNSISIDNVIFAGTVGNMTPANAVPSTSTGVFMSQLVADGNYRTTLVLTNYSMSGTCYAADGVTTSNAIASNDSASKTVGTATVSAPSGSSTAAFAIWPTQGTADSKCASWTDGTKQIRYYQAMTAEQFLNWTPNLTSAGYKLVQSYELNGNNSWIYQNGVYTVYASWLSAVGTSPRVRIVVEPYGGNFNTTKDFASSTRVCDSQIWQLDVDNYYGNQHAGMSYVIRLTNGEFIVVDGGYKSEPEADNLYAILTSNNVLSGKPVIAAWFITHLHDDHFGGMVRLARHYGDKVTVKGFYANFQATTVGDIAASGDIYQVMDSMARFEGSKYYAVHSGMKIGFADATATILATNEDVKQSYWKSGTLTANGFYDGNDTSTVVRFDIKNKDGNNTTKFLILGDACGGINNVLQYTWPAAELSANIVQVAHHGMNTDTSDITTTLYQTIGAGTYLWPADVLTYEDHTPRAYDAENAFDCLYIGHTRTTNKWIRDNASEIIPAWENVCLTLPYTTGSYLTASGIKDTSRYGKNTINTSTAYNRKLQMTTVATVDAVAMQQTTPSNNTTKLRFLATVSLDDGDISKLGSFGFDITMVYNGSVYHWTKEVNTVYTSVTAAGSAVTAANIHDGSDYIFAYVLNDVPAGDGQTVEFKVSCFGTLSTGEQLTSKAVGTYTVTDGVLASN